ncbi:hypothetical protein [Streptomyces sp. NPDC052114]
MSGTPDRSGPSGTPVRAALLLHGTLLLTLNNAEGHTLLPARCP